MSIRLKMLLPMLLLAVASIAAVLITVSVIFSGYVDDTIGEEVDIAGNILEKEAADLVDNAHIVAGEIAESEAVAEALLAGDGEAVLAAAETYLAEAGMDVLTVTDADGVVVASAQDPAAVGSAANQADIASALEGTAFAGFEEGGTVALAALAAEPVYGAEGQIIGAVSTGRDLGDYAFVDDTKALVQAEVTVFHRDTRLATTVIKADGSRAVGTQASDAVVEQVIGRGQPYTGTAAILDRDAFVEYTPLESNSGEVVGMLFTGKYTDVKSDALGQFIGFSLLVVAILLALAVPVCLYISGRIVKPIKVMVEAARQIALGDVNVHLDIDTKDETRQLADAFEDMTRGFSNQAEVLNAMADSNYDVEMRVASDKDVVGIAINRILDNNNRLLADIGENAKQVSSVSSQISDGSQNLAQATTEQSATVEELLASMNDIAEKTRENAKRAEHAADLAGSIKQNAEQGTAQMGRMTQAVEEINAASQSISAVIKVIDDIAFQTNILALNAAVEAARAGEHGKGFAVVADEVRNLAGKSAEAAKDTGKLIADTVEKAELGARIASETSQSLDTIVEGINESTTVVGEIAASSDQQNLAIEEVNKGIDQVSQVVQTNSATAEESAAAAEEMSSQAAMLQGMVAQFKLKGQPQNALPPASESWNSAPSLPAAGSNSGYIF